MVCMKYGVIIYLSIYLYKIESFCLTQIYRIED